MNASLETLSLHDLKVIVVLSETLHFGKAAEICGVTQPSLSASVKKVEELLGCQLFERSSRKSRLTREGETVVMGAQRALMAMEEAVDLGVRKSVKQRYRIGMIPTIGPYYVQHVIPQILAANSEMELVIVEAMTAQLEEMVLGRSLDGAVVSLPIENPAFSLQNLYQERLALAVNGSHAFASRTGVGVEEISAEDLLVLEQGHCLRAQTLETCKSSLIAERPLHTLGLPTLLGMVAAGAGYSVLPETAGDWIAVDRRVVLVPFAEPSPTRTVALMVLKSRETELALLSRVVSEFSQR